MTSKVRVDPLQHNVPIVDRQGYPTPQFLRQWQQTRGVDTAVGGLETGLEEHAAATLGVHGIANTENLILEGDARLANARTPLNHAASHYDSDALDLNFIPGILDGSKLYGDLNVTSITAVSAALTDVTISGFFDIPVGTTVNGFAWTGAGGAPFSGLPVGSALNVNFNSDLLGSQHAPYYLDRTNHTGTQAVGTITGLAAVATSGSATDLGTGTLPDLRLTSNIPQKNAANIFTAAQVVDRTTGTNNVLIFRVGSADSYTQTAAGTLAFQFVPGAGATSRFAEIATGELGMSLGSFFRVPALKVSATEVLTSGRALQNITGMVINAASRNAAASLEVAGTAGFFLLPRMTTAQRDAVSATPPDGAMLYNSTVATGQVRNAGAWVNF